MNLIKIMGIALKLYFLLSLQALQGRSNPPLRVKMKQSHENLRLPRRYATRNDLSYEIAALPMVAVNDTGSRNFRSTPNSKIYLLKTFLREGI